MATVGYAGTRGRNLWRNGDANVPVPETLADGTLFHPATAARPNASFSAIELKTSDGRSWYDALIVELRRGLERRARLPVLVHLLPQHRHDPGLDLLLRRHQRDGVLVPGGGPARLQQGPRRLPREAQLGLQPDLGPAVRRARAQGLARALFGDWQVAAIGQVKSGPPLTALRPVQPLALAVVAVARPRAGLRPPEPRPRPHAGERHQRHARAVVRPDRLRAAARGHLREPGPRRPRRARPRRRSTSRSSSGCAGPASGRRARSSCASRPSTSSTTRTSASPACRRSRAPRDGEAPLPTLGRIRATATSSRQVQLGVRVRF